ncbi:MAG: DUF2802 domain-containing protein [Burkholderiales bacterium]
MDNIVITWRELLIVAIVVLAVYAAEMLLLLRFGRSPGIRMWRRGAKASAESFAVAPLRDEIGELKRQLAEVRAELAALKGAPPAREATPTPYAQAIQLAKGGGQAGELAARCGISRGEAELIVALYRKRETS